MLASHCPGALEPRALAPGTQIVHNVLGPRGGGYTKAPRRRVVAVDFGVPGQLNVHLHQRQEGQGPPELARH